MNNISSTTWLLLSFAKSAGSTFSFEKIKEVLSPVYHEEMNLHDVLSICMLSLQEVISEPKFQVQYGSQMFNKVLLAPLERGPFTPEPKDISEFYDMILSKLMHALRYTRSDWCKEMITNV